MLHLITGGSRSGKSRYAEQLAARHDGPVCYVATAEVRDEEFAERVREHRRHRPAHWRWVEAERALAAELLRHDQEDGLLLVDCLGMWLIRFFDDKDELDAAGFAEERALLLEAVASLQGQLLIVTNEIGWGAMPVSAMARRYGDLLGKLNQDLAAQCDHVTLMACGLPLALKQTAHS
ncbi:bifunctional adenosylcobinamide kinase/adenosylcobinamide-phosphate guanylyltransferase [uncultured Aquitalea sp.]|uniref:bifunctional adenosylcobinamide kinase/adenosylcobinamide-phosphate guanylyltransferase n=1 Tax=uncultured Aquitalea sp. TaxID=540272 RepID=UPI0025D43B08|nr:bifunctional adenosylcobinamide kinase/adenosylcobinamide-phosphate guanylyltransferase [uncultured Aquitalea sp.]